jgi:hypothetical protein
MITLIIKNTGKGFEWYGNCEVCGNRCDHHYKQWTPSHGGNKVGKFGHKECLKINGFELATVDEKV